jgi:hypothetical protein
MGRMGAEDPSRAFPAEPPAAEPLAPAYYATAGRPWSPFFSLSASLRSPSTSSAAARFGPPFQAQCWR